MTADPYERYTEFRRGEKRSVAHEHRLRSAVAKDRDRVIHCGAFRRLQRKSQIVGVQANDFFRTRLTHTIECAQIGRAIAQRSLESDDLHLVVNEKEHFPDLIEAACLAHDLGHPPFGHNGEKALQKMTYEHGRRMFEGNAQSFRIVTNLEPRFHVGDRWCGLDLTRATLKAILKYPWTETDPRAAEKDKFCVYEDTEDRAVFDWLYGDEPVADRKRTIATDVLEAADDIAYAVHDFEDGVWSQMIPLFRFYDAEGDERSRLFQKAAQMEPDLFENVDPNALLDQLLPEPSHQSWASVPFDRSRRARAELKEFCASLIGDFIAAATPGDKFTAPSGDEKRLLVLLMAMARAWMIESPSQETLRFGQRRLVEDLFEGYWANTGMLQRETWSRVAAPTAHDRDLSGDKNRSMRPEELPIWTAKARVICDHVAGMTDLYALHTHREMYAGGSAPNLRLM